MVAMNGVIETTHAPGVAGLGWMGVFCGGSEGEKVVVVLGTLFAK